MKIIIVDDEISALHVFLSEIIHEKDFEYKFFEDDEQAILHYVSANHVEAAFLDINMPNINGVELARRLIAQVPKIKIIFITGLSVDIDGLDEDVKSHTIGFVYKPYDIRVLNKYLSVIKDETPVLTAKMFGSFDCFIGNHPVLFSSGKSKELFALLLVYRGKSLTMSDAISQLWPDYDLEKAKKLYRDAVWRLRRTLDDINFPCVTFNRALLILDRQNIRCDYWDFLNHGEGEYNGEFLKNYDWSIDYLYELDKIASGRY